MDSSLSSSPPPSNPFDLFTWLQTLPPLPQWNHPSISTPIFSSLHLTADSQPPPPTSDHPTAAALRLSIAVPNLTPPISLWTSKPFDPQTQNPKTTQTLFTNIIGDIFKYGANPFRSSAAGSGSGTDSYSFLITNLGSSFPEAFNLAFVSLTFLVGVYELAPSRLRLPCLLTLNDRLSSAGSRRASWRLMRALGSALEERWMRTLNLAITSWKAELIRAAGAGTAHLPLTMRCPSPLFSYALSTAGMWKVQVYCPLSAMEVENSSGLADDDDRLMFSLNYHQLEGVVQLNYKVTVNEKWVDLMVNVDNIRFNVVPLVNDAILKQKGAGAPEKHFPSKILLQLTPTPPSTDILGVSVSKSSDNPAQEIGRQRGIEGSLDPSAMPGFKVSASDTTTTTLKPWKFEESAQGDGGSMSWFLHDAGDGREVFSSRPSLVATLFRPRAWFKDRYSSATRAFTRQGGVVFAKDEYGEEAVWWKVDKAALGKTMKFEVKGSVGLTYWPNKYKTLYNETRRADFRDTFELTLI